MRLDNEGYDLKDSMDCAMDSASVTYTTATAVTATINNRPLSDIPIQAIDISGIIYFINALV